MRPMVGGKVDGPGEICGCTVAAAGHETSHPTEGVTQRNTWCDYVRDSPQGQFMVPAIDDGSGGGADQAAIINEAGPHVENVRERFACEFFVPIGNHIEQTSAENSADNDPGSEINNAFAIQAGQG